MKAHLLRYLVAAVVLAGCAATGPEFQPVAAQADKATVYIYRPDLTLWMGGYPYVSVGAEKKYALLNNGYRVMTLPPGKHSIRFQGTTFGTNWPAAPVSHSVDLQAGQEYFIRAYPELLDKNRPLVGRTRVELVAREEALRELASVRLITD